MCSRQPRARCDDRRIENETTNTKCVLSVFHLGVFFLRRVRLKEIRRENARDPREVP